METIRKMETGKVLRAMMCLFSLAFLIAAVLAPDMSEMFSGLGRICTLPAQLTKDYFKPEQIGRAHV